MAELVRVQVLIPKVEADRFGDERREPSSQPKPKTAKIPKTACLPVNAMVDPVGPQAPPALLRSA